MENIDRLNKKEEHSVCINCSKKYNSKSNNDVKKEEVSKNKQSDEFEKIKSIINGC